MDPVSVSLKGIVCETHVPFKNSHSFSVEGERSLPSNPFYLNNSVKFSNIIIVITSSWSSKCKNEFLGRYYKVDSVLEE